MRNEKLFTAIGTIEIKKRDGKVISLKLPQNPSPLSFPLPFGERCPEVLSRVQRGGRVRGYKDLLNLIPDLGIGTPFQKKIWQYIRKIPYGHIVTYKKIAEDLNLGHAYRAVGQACKQNPIPIVIPCHRVVSSNGAFGGYSAGLNWKMFLLELEKSRIREKDLVCF